MSLYNKVWAPKFFSGKTIAYCLIAVIFILLAIFTFIQVKGVYNKVHDNWNEFTFVYNHPNLVKTIEVDWASKSAQLESSYTNHTDPQAELIQAVVKQLQTPAPTPYNYYWSK